MVSEFLGLFYKACLYKDMSVSLQVSRLGGNTRASDSLQRGDMEESVSAQAEEGVTDVGPAGLLFSLPAVVLGLGSHLLLSSHTVRVCRSDENYASEEHHFFILILYNV